MHLLLELTNDKSDLNVNNVSLRSLELIVGIVILSVGLFFLGICILAGPGILSIIIGVSATSSGYYFAKRGGKGLLDIRKATKKKALLNKEIEVLD